MKHHIKTLDHPPFQFRKGEVFQTRGFGEDLNYSTASHSMPKLPLMIIHTVKIYPTLELGFCNPEAQKIPQGSVTIHTISLGLESGTSR
jgi:hypothetical protein